MKKHFIDVINVWLDSQGISAREEDVEALAETLAYTKVNWLYPSIRKKYEKSRRLLSDNN